MALLLAMYQKMRLIREKNQATLDLTKYSSKVSRVQKNIERVQKKYTSMLAKIDQQAKMMESQATSIFQQKLGLGLQNFGGNFVNPYTFGGTNGFVLQMAGNFFGQGYPVTYEDGDKQKQFTWKSTAKYQEMLKVWNQNGGRRPAAIVGADNNPEYRTGDEAKLFGKIANDTIPKYKQFTEEDWILFEASMQQAQIAQNQAYMTQQQLTQSFSSNVSIWADAMKAQIEAEQDQALEPLHYQETMWELEKTQLDMKLKRINAELESYEQLVSEEAKNTAPTFGLR